MSKMSLSRKLILFSIALAVVPMFAIASISIYSLLKLNRSAADNGREGAKIQALKLLENIVAAETRTGLKSLGLASALWYNCSGTRRRHDVGRAV